MYRAPTTLELRFRSVPVYVTDADSQTNVAMMKGKGRPESITCSDHDVEILLSEPVSDLCKIGGLAHTIDPNEYDGIRLALSFAGTDLCQHINAAGW